MVNAFGQHLVCEDIQLASNVVSRLILVLGQSHYYTRFGFVPAAEYMLEWPGST